MPATSTTPRPSNPAARRPLRVIAAILVVLGAGAVAYTALTPTPTSTGTAAAAAPVAAGPSLTAPSFTATTSTGGQVMVPGGKPSAVLFFAATCGTCGPAAHALAVAQQAAPNAANYVAVDINPNETAEDIAAFLTRNQASTLASTTDASGELTSRFAVTQLSSAVFLAPDGHVLGRTVEPTTAQIQAQLRAAGTE